MLRFYGNLATDTAWATKYLGLRSWMCRALSPLFSPLSLSLCLPITQLSLFSLLFFFQWTSGWTGWEWKVLFLHTHGFNSLSLLPPEVQRFFMLSAPTTAEFGGFFNIIQGGMKSLSMFETHQSPSFRCQVSAVKVLTQQCKSALSKIQLKNSKIDFFLATRGQQKQVVQTIFDKYVDKVNMLAKNGTALYKCRMNFSACWPIKLYCFVLWLHGELTVKFDSLLVPFFNLISGVQPVHQYKMQGDIFFIVLQYLPKGWRNNQAEAFSQSWTVMSASAAAAVTLS